MKASEQFGFITRESGEVRLQLLFCVRWGAEACSVILERSELATVLSQLRPGGTVEEVLGLVPIAREDAHGAPHCWLLSDLNARPPVWGEVEVKRHMRREIRKRIARVVPAAIFEFLENRLDHT